MFPGHFISMNKLLSYYQKELNFLKTHGKAFANRFPKIARRLGMVEGESEDPHVSRLIESFALLTARIHQRLDDDIPEVVDALLSTLAPQYLRPLPSACIVMMASDQQKSGLTGKNILPAQMKLYTRQSTPVTCEFKTVYPVTLLPVAINAAVLSFNSDVLNWQLRLDFRIWPGALLSDDAIRIYLHGPDNAVKTLYTLLCSEIKELTLRQGDINFDLGIDAIHPVGFEDGESMFTCDTRIAPVHILLLDYFWFPHKFSFIDLRLPVGFSMAGDNVFELLVVFKRNTHTERLEKISSLVDVNFFRLHCTPAVNLFSRCTEPIMLNDAIEEYLIVPDARQKGFNDVWEIEQVSVQCKVDNCITHYPVFSLLERRAVVYDGNDSGMYWQSFRREKPGAKGDEAQSFIAFGESPVRRKPSSQEIVTLKVTCTNHNLPNQMQYGSPEGDFEFDVLVAGLKSVALTHPTKQKNPTDKRAMRWRFLSQLSLNYQLLDGKSGAERLKEILALYSFDENSENTPFFTLIQTLNCQPVTARLISNDPHSLARGIELTVTFSREVLQDPEYYLFCCLLDRLLALYAPVNSFTRLITCVESEVQTRRVWPIRAGKLSWL